eukprot:6205133-Pleurochrysis_carterae.AAC.3
MQLLDQTPTKGGRHVSRTQRSLGQTSTSQRNVRPSVGWGSLGPRCFRSHIRFDREAFGDEERGEASPDDSRADDADDAHVARRRRRRQGRVVANLRHRRKACQSRHWIDARTVSHS